jgi:transposase
VEKGGLASELATAGLHAEDQVGWADEMRVGLRGTVRRVWGRRGVPVRQVVQFTYEWRHLFVVVNGRAGRVHWAWLPNLQAETIAAAIGGLGRGQTEVDAIVWDRAPAHRDGRMRPFARSQGLAVIEQPPYAPELNPAERLIEEIRRAVDGRVYATIEEKIAAVDGFLLDLDADPDRVRRLADWDWIDQAFATLPALSPPIAA